MNADVKYIVILIHKPNRLLHLSVCIHFLQSRELSYAVIDVGDEVAGLQTVYFLERERFISAVVSAKPEAVITVEDLVVGVGCNLMVVIDEPFVQ